MTSIKSTTITAAITDDATMTSLFNSFHYGLSFIELGAELVSSQSQDYTSELLCGIRANLLKIYHLLTCL
jgi:hypothetical protein